MEGWHGTWFVVHRSMRIPMLAVLLVFSTLAGCSAPGGARSATVSAWACQQGGEIRGPHFDRMLAACESVLNAVDQDGMAIRLHVIASDAATAYAWPSGDIYLSRGLVDLLSDDEIAAAVAHELGHLVGDGHLSSPATLDGSQGETGHALSGDEEHRADLVGCRILACCHVQPDAMARLLRKVHDAQPAKSAIRPLIRQRLDALAVR